MARYVKNFAQLRAGPLQSRRNGTESLTTGGVRVGLRIWPNFVNAVWCINGKRYAQAIKRVRLPYRRGGFATRFECPTCGKVTTVLFLAPGPGKFVCRDCARATRYRAWKETGRTRQPKKADNWLKWFSRQATKILAKGERSE
ncbi:hypothetical protein [Neomoorella mulderi]|uniref:Uncharacterized protein n=1 Tax=Moorella mulderi DSM 14980 TaxID=1122241 RepID=A0A151AU22_9FIRM|nr:hypothetical protein [Moorella mulderi]KYH31135.1 hypothetical protein MOMUL_26680 [Moorella mulderi DSM 14980]